MDGRRVPSPLFCLVKVRVCVQRGNENGGFKSSDFVSTDTHFPPTICLEIELSYPIIVAILCNHDCINLFETKRFYWIFVWYFGKVRLILSGAIIFVSRSFLPNLKWFGRRSWIWRPQRFLRSSWHHVRPEMAYLWVYQDISTKISTFRVENKAGSTSSDDAKYWVLLWFLDRMQPISLIFRLPKRLKRPNI